MFYIYLYLNLFVVLVGLFMIESGDLGGYPNGSVYPYILYMVLFILSYAFLGNKSTLKWKKLKFKFFLVPQNTSQQQRNIAEFKNKIGERVKKRIFLALLILLLLVLFAFNGLEVIKGNMDKGAFRSQMGFFGFALAIPIKFLFPAFFTRICLSYYNNIRTFGKPKIDRWFYIFAVMAVLLGLSNGDKSMTVTTLLCGFIALFWQRTTLKHLLVFGVFGILLMVGGAFLFDRNVEQGNFKEAIEYLRFRTFALTAESPWKMWDLFINDKLYDFNYPITLANIFGAKGIEIFFGVSRDSVNFYMFNFPKQVTATLYPQYVQLVNSGEWNITPSAYVEGMVMAGYLGIAVIAVFAGWLASSIKVWIMKSIYNFNYAKASALIVYFVYGYMPWFQSGGITTLIHPITIAGTVLSYFFIKYFEKVSLDKQ